MRRAVLIAQVVRPCARALRLGREDDTVVDARQSISLRAARPRLLRARACQPSRLASLFLSETLEVELQPLSLSLEPPTRRLPGTARKLLSSNLVRGLMLGKI